MSEEKECELFDDFGIIMQVGLGLLSFSMLFAKRAYEYPKRSKRIFMLDISKQAFSAGWQHAINLSLAVYLQQSVSRGNGCEWYFINFICEICFGVLLCYLIHSFILYFANKYDILILQSGVYLSIHDAQYIYRYTWEELDKHINYKVWFIQLVVWLMISTISKLIVFVFELQYAEELIDMGISALSIFKGHPNLELLFVMVIVPFTLNCFQYWIQDNFLKGTDYIQNSKKNKEKSVNEMNNLYIMQDGMIDFQKNRQAYR